MLTYSLEERGREPLYEFLYRKIRDDILSGAIAGGEALPSKRALAKNLNISIITVENAYAQLMTEGYIYSRPRSGFFAADVSDARLYLDEDIRKAKDGPARLRSSARHADVKPEGTAKEGTAKEGTAQPVFADFASNETEPEKFPFTIWARLSREVLANDKQHLMTNPPTGGVMQLREAVADHLHAFRGIDISAEQVIIGAGTEYLYGLLLQLLGMDRIYALEDPGYRKVELVCRSHGVQVRRVRLDEQGLSVRALAASDAEVVHVTPAHHFPTGITMPAKRRYELLRWAAQKPGRYIVEDDYDSEFRLSGRPLPALLGMDTADRVIYMNTFTKTLASTMRISYMVLPLPLLAAFREKLRFYACTVPTFEQYTLALFIKEGYFEKHINRMRTLSRKKRDLLLSCIEESGLEDCVSVSEEHAGLHFMLTVHGNIQEKTLLRALAENGIRMARFEDYEADAVTGTNEKKREQLPLSFVVNYSSVPLARIPEAVERIGRALEKARLR